MGFDPNVAILFSGIGTLIFFAAVGGRVPSYLGLELLVHRGGDRGDGVRRQRTQREHPGGARRHRRRRRRVHDHRPRRDEGRLRVDRDADAARRDRRRGGGDRAQSRADRGQGDIGQHVRHVDRHRDHRRGWPGRRARARPCATTADPAGRRRGLPPLRCARQRPRLGQADRFRHGRRRAVDRIAEVRSPGVERAGDGAHRAGRDRPRRGKSGPCQSGRSDDRPESRSLISDARSWATASRPSSRARAAARASPRTPRTSASWP